MTDTRFFTGFLAAAALLGLAGTAAAQTQILDPSVFTPYIDLRVSATDGAASWIDGGLGKTLHGGSDSTLNTSIAEAGLVWRPKFSWTLTGYAHLQYTDYQNSGVSLVEGFVRYRPVPTSAWRFSGRAGVFYPPVSMEHVEDAWATYATISASAINSWIGEEIKGTGIEMTVERNFAGQEVSLTGGVFGADDTTGVFVSFRGWALHDMKTGQGGDYTLQVLPTQVNYVHPFLEADNRAGYYLRLDWSPTPDIDLNIITWDNRADPTTVASGSPSWLTKFVNVGASWQISDNYQLIGQAMSGTTVVGAPPATGRYQLDFAYRSAFALLVREDGPHVIGVRADWFEVEDRSTGTAWDLGESGWAATAAYRYQLSDNQLIAAEVMRVYSDRPARQAFGNAAAIAETQVQLSWRISL